MKKVISLLLALSLLLSVTVCGANASEYPDLPETHWAYEAMNDAAELGIIQGVGNGMMAPQGTLTWAQLLTMLCRAFAGDDYRRLTESGVAWDRAAYTTALEHGFLLQNDVLPIWEEALGEPITRQETAVLLSRVLPQAMTAPEESSAGAWYLDDWIEPSALTSSSAALEITDYDEINLFYRDAVSCLFDLGIVRGKEDGSFGPHDTLQRCDGTVLLMRTLEKLDGYLFDQPITILLTLVDEEGNICLSETAAEGRIGGSLAAAAQPYLPRGYETDEDAAVRRVSSAGRSYTVTIRERAQSELDQEEAYALYRSGQMTEEEYYMQDFWLRQQGPNLRKYVLLFGDKDKRGYESKEEAKADMTVITVPVWRLRGDSKVSGTASITIHAALADDVLEIFTEIYNDPEQFPIADVGGFSWRGDTSSSEHNLGAAIDINSDQNYQISADGTIRTGSYWKPGEDPYSIPEDGSVVRIFKEHGWSWGGNAWQSSHDYMHFSYFGN